MPLLDGQLEVDSRQFFPEGPDLESVFDLAQAGEFLRRPGPPAVGQRRAFHRFSHSIYIVTSGSQVKAPAGISAPSTTAALASPM